MGDFMWELFEGIFDMFGEEMINGYFKPFSEKKQKIIHRILLYSAGVLLILALIGLFLFIEGKGIARTIGIILLAFSLSLIILYFIIGFTLKLISKIKKKQL